MCHFKLFPEISYEDDSYQKIDTGCYYNEATEVDFSPSGKYAIIRIRGDYDPQEGDRRKILFTPIYFSSVFVLNVHTMQMVFQYDGSDMKEAGFEIQAFKGLAWRADPCDIRKCQLALFIDDNSFAYVNKDYNIEIYAKQNKKMWVRTHEIRTRNENVENRAKRGREIYKLEYDKSTEEFVCNSNLRYKRKQDNGIEFYGKSFFNRNRFCKKI